MAKDQEGQTYQSSAPESSEDQKREQRARLIKALSRFKPRDANPLQFYNCVRELCIMHNCSIDEGLERAAITWPGLSMRQRELYDSVRLSEIFEEKYRNIQRFWSPFRISNGFWIGYPKPHFHNP